MPPVAIRLLYLAMLLLIARPLFAAPQPAIQCSALPRSGWISWLEVEAMLRQSGMRLVQLRITDQRCYEVIGLDQRGERRAYQMHPVTGEILSASSGEEPPRGVPWRFGKKAE